MNTRRPGSYSGARPLTYEFSGKVSSNNPHKFSFWLPISEETSTLVCFNSLIK